jgi:hypothetical protein
MLSALFKVAHPHITHSIRKENLGVNTNIDNFVANHGDEKVASLEVVRRVFSNSVVMEGINTLSPNWKRKNNYSELFHLYVVINGKYKLNKDEVLKVVPFSSKSAGSESMTVRMGGRSLTIREMFQNTKNAIGVHKMATYNIKSANCQHLILDFLRSNGLLDDDLTDFIKQKTDENISDDLRKTTNTVTDVARVLNPVKEFVGNAYFTNPLDSLPFKLQGTNPM